MFSITYPELVHLYQPVERTLPRQVVEPSEGVWGRSTHNQASYNQRKLEREGLDFSAVFSKVMERTLR